MKTQHKISLAKAAYSGVSSARRLVGLSDETITKRRGLRYELDLSEGIDFAIFLLGAFEPGTVATLQKLIKPGFTVLDVGANVGAHTLHMAQGVGKNGRVLAFEPTAYAFTKLNRNIALNPDLAPRISAYRVFLSGEDGALLPEEICSSWPLTGEHTLHPGHLGAANSTDGASSIKIDTIIERERVAKVDLVKMDVDGFECAVLSGAREMIARDKPIFLFEYAPYLLAEQGSTLEQFLEFFTLHDYRFSDADTGEMLSVQALRSMGVQGASKNVVATA